MWFERNFDLSIVSLLHILIKVSCAASAFWASCCLEQLCLIELCKIISFTESDKHCLHWYHVSNQESFVCFERVAIPLLAKLMIAMGYDSAWCKIQSQSDRISLHIPMWKCLLSVLTINPTMLKLKCDFKGFFFVFKQSVRRIYKQGLIPTNLPHKTLKVLASLRR